MSPTPPSPVLQEALPRDEAISPVLQECLPRDEAAFYIGLQPSTLADWWHNGKHRDELPCARIGKRSYYRKADLDRWIAKQFS